MAARTLAVAPPERVEVTTTCRYMPLDSLPAVFSVRDFRRRRVKSEIGSSLGLHSGALRLPGVGHVRVESSGWSRSVQRADLLECKYLNNGNVVAAAAVALDGPDRSVLHALRLEVAQAWRGQGIGAALMDRILNGGRPYVKAVKGHCDSDGRWRWLGVFDWDPEHSGNNREALRATLLPPSPRALRGASASQIQQVAAFVARLNSAVGGRSQGPFGLSPSATSIVFSPGGFRTADEALDAVLNRVSTGELRSVATASGGAAVDLIRFGHDWYGRKLL